MVSDLTYDLRSGDPDFLDKMVGTHSPTWPWNASPSGCHGRMMAIQKGCYTRYRNPRFGTGPPACECRTECTTSIASRPNFTGKNGMPIFLNPLSEMRIGTRLRVTVSRDVQPTLEPAEP